MATKLSTPCVITDIHRITMQSHMSYSSCSCFVCLTGPYTFVYMFKSSSNVFLWVQFSHTDHWMFNMAPHGKELSEDLRVRIVALHKDGLGLKKFGNSLGLSYSTVARVIQRLSKTGFTRNRPRNGRSKKLSPCAVRQVQKLLQKTDAWVLPALL